MVDDEPKIRELVATYLTHEGFMVLTAEDGERALAVLAREQVDLLVLDLMLPGISGLELFQRIRAQRNLPVIMLTARAEDTDKLLGLELGADDYMTKPFNPRELAARIRAVLRRTGGLHQTEAAPANIIRYEGGLSIDFDGGEVTLGDRPVSLTPTEFKFLVTLARRPGRIFSRLQLMESALGEFFEGYERTVDTHISNLRRKIEPAGSEVRYIITVYGLGYKFVSGQGGA